MDLRMYSKLWVILFGLVPTTILLLLSFIPLGISFTLIFDKTYDFSFPLMFVPIAGFLGYIGMLSILFNFSISKNLRMYFLITGILTISYVALSNIPELNKSTTNFDICFFIYFFLAPFLVAIYHLFKIYMSGKSVT
ncbi:hypothetical protein [Paraglaciecola hydrolytica]|uniref:Uncharacterized protein n=1 Tax=Paraglaciecola hydrolytica TaxID=1799789 RepID=A0A136A1N0_9ALTE|nr:hypothetical protein [Paraglaciecola hydrolytica]KXI29142.1 hypothetical protein AX660_13380 [Paraglaciecola hydrolytica]